MATEQKFILIIILFLLIISYDTQVTFIDKGCRGHYHMVVGYTTTMQSVLITTNVVSSNPAQARCTRYIM